MTTKTRPGNAERLGRWLGQSWRGAMRRERQTAGWLVAQGVPATGATALLWIVKLVVLGALLYAAFWLALLLLFALAAAWVARDTPPEQDDERAEWRMGWSGYGLYRGETRVDPGLPDDGD
jgi:hypothetical protein